MTTKPDPRLAIPPKPIVIESPGRDGVGIGGNGSALGARWRQAILIGAVTGTLVSGLAAAVTHQVEERRVQAAEATLLTAAPTAATLPGDRPANLHYRGTAPDLGPHALHSDPRMDSVARAALRTLQAVRGDAPAQLQDPVDTLERRAQDAALVLAKQNPQALETATGPVMERAAVRIARTVVERNDQLILAAATTLAVAAHGNADRGTARPTPHRPREGSAR